MSITVNNSSIIYGEQTNIITNDLNNVIFSPMETIQNIEYNGTNYIATVNPKVTTIYYIYGYDNLTFEPIILSTTIYVNIYTPNTILYVNRGSTIQLNVYGSTNYNWSPPDYLNQTNTSNVLCTPFNDIKYTIIGTDQFSTISETYINLIHLILLQKIQ